MNVNKELVKKVMNQIIAHPETWNQSRWHCETTHCFAGWAQVLSGDYEKHIEQGTNPKRHCRIDAQTSLNIDHTTAVYLFESERTLEDLYLWSRQAVGDEVEIKLL